jgi:hypothetical protein
MTRPRRPEPTTKAGTGSCIGSGMSIVGYIECNGPAQVFGRIKGELHASDLLIGDGAQSRTASLRRTSQSAAAIRARSVPFASSCRTVVRSRVTFSPAKPPLVLVLDYRGHGQSEYDRNPDNYTLPVGTRRPLGCDYCKSPNLFV